MRTIIRTTLALALITYTWWAFSALSTNRAGGVLHAAVAAILVILISIALLRRRTFGQR